jgi:alkyl hydroperoxide reductase subunit AhpF
MALLGDDDTKYLRDSFAALASDVTITVVTRERSRLVIPGSNGDASAADGDASDEIKQIVGEVAATSPRLKVEHVDAAADAERADELVGSRTPALVFGSAGAQGTLRYFGLPAGYEMSTLVAALMDLGSGEPMVPPEVSDALAKLDGNVHIQVFVTPS